MLRVRILGSGQSSDEKGKKFGEAKINVNLPLSVAEVVLESGLFNPTGGENDPLKKIDLRQIVALVKIGVMGKIVEIESENGDIVEVWVE